MKRKRFQSYLVLKAMNTYGNKPGLSCLYVSLYN